MAHSPVRRDSRSPLPEIPERSTSTNSTTEIIGIVTRAVARRKRREGEIGQPELELRKHEAIVNGDM